MLGTLTLGTVCAAVPNGSAIVLQAAEMLGAAGPVADSTLNLYVGSVKTLKLGNVKRLAVGNDAVVSASVLDSGEVLVIPKAEGLTDVQVWSDSGRPRVFRIRVTAVPTDDRVQTIKTVMASFPDVSVRESNGTIVLSGFVAPDEFARFGQMVGSFDKVVSTVRPRPVSGLHPLVEFDVRIVEISKKYERNLGIRWDTLSPGPSFGTVTTVIPNNHFGVVGTSTQNVQKSDLQDMLGSVSSGAAGMNSYLGWTSIIGSQLNLLQENGAARVLAEPRLSTLSGETAKFLAGGQLPVAILNEFGQPVVDYKDYGIKLEISPTVDEQNNIRSSIKTEVSSIDNGTVVNGVPGLLDRSTESVINSRPGDTIAISGLVNVTDSRVLDKMPFLGSVPILGALFKSKDFQQQRTDLVMLVTPRLQSANEPVATDVQSNIEQMHRVFGGSSKIDSKLIE
jgi:pilus assembly protein CpaC